MKKVFQELLLTQHKNENRRIYMLKLKKIISCVLAVVMVLSMGTTAFAIEPSNVVYIDASMFSESELDVVIREAQDGVNMVIVSWEDAMAIIKPITEPEVAPRFNLKNETYSLTTTWTSLGTDWPIFQWDLKVTNHSGNPGAIDICVKEPDYLNEDYFWGLNAGYYTEFSLTTIRTSELWVKASSVSGDYKISAVCS